LLSPEAVEEPIVRAGAGARVDLFQVLKLQLIPSSQSLLVLVEQVMGLTLLSLAQLSASLLLVVGAEVPMAQPVAVPVAVVAVVAVAAPEMALRISTPAALVRQVRATAADRVTQESLFTQAAAAAAALVLQVEARLLLTILLAMAETA
jgi:hypothetical protein